MVIIAVKVWIREEKCNSNQQSYLAFSAIPSFLRQDVYWRSEAAYRSWLKFAHKTNLQLYKLKDGTTYLLSYMIEDYSLLT